mmetsp:Transcript_9716/g.32954  ORF Transcript_9716/g.32954 Transcript_9716/m.32954 type:complete len:283 (+) Transcript_9716:383-1231(+)
MTPGPTAGRHNCQCLRGAAPARESGSGGRAQHEAHWAPATGRPRRLTLGTRHPRRAVPATVVPSPARGGPRPHARQSLTLSAAAPSVASATPCWPSLLWAPALRAGEAPSRLGGASRGSCARSDAHPHCRQPTARASRGPTARRPTRARPGAHLAGLCVAKRVWFVGRRGLLWGADLLDGLGARKQLEPGPGRVVRARAGARRAGVGPVAAGEAIPRSPAAGRVAGRPAAAAAAAQGGQGGKAGAAAASALGRGPRPGPGGRTPGAHAPRGGRPRRRRRRHA